MQVYKDGIEKTIRESEWGTYKDRGYVKIETEVKKEIEVPEEEEIEEVKPKTKKGGKKGV